MRIKYFQTAIDGKSWLAIINVYCPRADPELPEREVFKLKFYKLLELRAMALQDGGCHVIVLGDINTSHRRIDHCDPSDEFEERPGRQWMSHFLNESDATQTELMDWKTPSTKPKFVDSFRHLNPDRKEAFTCWNTKMNCRSTNYGTRIDYILISEDLKSSLSNSDIRPEIHGSDHCPVQGDFDFALQSSEKLTSYCTKNFTEFSGKQQKISAYFSAKLKPYDVQAPPTKRLKAVEKQQTLTSFFTKTKVGKTLTDEKFLDDFCTEKNHKAANDWKRLMAGPPPAPLCKGHQEPSVQRVVKKPGPNQGRKFWVCHRGEGRIGDKNARCDFFQWLTK